MFQTIVRLYNQTLDKYTRNWCTIYTLYMIFQLQWGFIVNNDYIINTLKQAEKEKAWNQSWGAYFSTIYKWFVDKMYDMLKIKLTVKTVDINSDEFEKYLTKWYAFWLGLKNWNGKYFEFTSDGVLTQEDLEDIRWFGGWSGHNHCYYNGYIIDSVWTLKDQTIELSIENLRYAVKIGLYYPTARTLVMTDKLLEKYLKMYQNWEVIENVEDLPIADQKAIARASKLRIFKK